MTRRTIALVVGLAASSATLPAQTPASAPNTTLPSPAERAAQSGDLGAAERALYDATLRNPRDPSARGALGAWLAARGRLKVGAVLLEEARLFGADAASVAPRLAHIYTWQRDWASLSALPASPLSAAEKERVRILAERGSTIVGDDSTVVTFAPLEVGALGRIPLRIGSDTLWADVDPQVEGLVLPGVTGGGDVEVVGSDRLGPVAIVREAAVGSITMKEVPARIDATLGAGRARLGLDLFAALAPSVDAKAGTVRLRRDGQVSAPDLEDELPLLLGFSGARVATRPGEAMVMLAAPAGRAALRGVVWTLDLRRGSIRRQAP